MNRLLLEFLAGLRWQPTARAPLARVSAVLRVCAEGWRFDVRSHTDTLDERVSVNRV